MVKVVSNSLAQTAAIAKRFSKLLCPTDVAIFDGPLGAGKTTFIKNLIAAFGFNPKKIISPTFTIIREYGNKKVRLYHIDLYRLNGASELKSLGYQDYVYTPQGITLIEWGDRIRDILPKYIEVTISFLSFTSRRFTFKTKGYPRDKLKGLVKNISFMPHAAGSKRLAA